MSSINDANLAEATGNAIGAYNFATNNSNNNTNNTGKLFDLHELVFTISMFNIQGANFVAITFTSSPGDSEFIQWKTANQENRTDVETRWTAY